MIESAVVESPVAQLPRSKLGERGVLQLKIVSWGFLCLVLLSENLKGFASPVEFPISLEIPAIAQSTAPAGFLQEGIYLYGESPVPNQVGQAYMIFEVTSDRVIGAFYMLNSSFDCFSGKPQGNQLTLTIVDSYTQESHSYGIAIHHSAMVAAHQGSGTEPGITLEGFHPIASISDNDHRILATCKADLAFTTTEAPKSLL
ncbi:MAG: hypothetical protein HC825_01505 [Oscillatoriales cyanobacterium RM1_1_9]|nr:hypothetical protein [Oscillatoriales cyanobacterium RM1_1_9]